MSIISPSKYSSGDSNSEDEIRRCSSQTEGINNPLKKLKNNKNYRGSFNHNLAVIDNRRNTTVTLNSVRSGGRIMHQNPRDNNSFNGSNHENKS